MIAVPYLNYKQELFKQLKDAGIPLNSIQESSLRFEFDLENGKSDYVIDTAAIKGSSRTELKLNQKDQFAFCAMQMGHIKYNPSLENEGIQPVQYSINEMYLGYTVPADAQQLEAIYNGQLSIKDGNITKMQNYLTKNFRETSVTQQTSAANKSSSSGIFTGLALITPTYKIGENQTEIALSFKTPKAGINWAHTVADTRVKVVLFLHGFLLKGINK